ncbi:hypothetical protein HD806DRAFT_507624 [Xylariaceae sp. AK1471]|nr:hypothetical protein HD806DRAFT_507624 [Xylariaceae sp. AK1471]
MADPGNSIDAAIEQVLQQNPVAVSENEAQTQQQQDHQQLPRNSIDAAIERLLQQNPGTHGENESHAREQQDYQRLRRLSLATTSGDTLVIVGFPAGNFIDCYGNKWETKKFWMNSEQLLATGSAVFTNLLSPKGQVHARRRLDRYLQSPASARFVLDLTPQMEGDESAYNVTQLSLSEGVRDWWRSHDIYHVSRYMVSGHDDNCPNHIDIPVPGYKTPKKTDGPTPVDLDDLEYPDSRKILDYCPIRHRAAILRLLMAICHGELVLNSAPRVATVAVMAKSLDCTHVVRDSVLIWLVAEPNQNFIDTNTEDALKIGWTLKLPSITRVAFQVLVTERALDILAGDKFRKANIGRRSWFGRPYGSVTEEQETCIQHAAQKMAQRAEDMWKQLNSPDVNQCLGLTEWPDSHPAVCEKIRQYIRKILSNTMNDAMGSDYLNLELDAIDQKRVQYVPAANFISTRDIYLNLSPAQQILTPYFWNSFAHLAKKRDEFFMYVPCPVIDMPPQILGSGLQKLPFNRGTFYHQLSLVVRNLRDIWVQPNLEVNISKTRPLVLGLSDEEYKFLPLWAGGLDDGTGGVYQTEIPDAERGFPIGPGPSFRTGETVDEDDDDGDTADETATIATGTGTVTMTEGYSFMAAPSQTTGAGHEGDDIAALNTATTGFSLATAEHSAATPVVEEEDTTAVTTSSADNFDWLSDVSDDLDNLDDFDDDAKDEDYQDIR